MKTKTIVIVALIVVFIAGVSWALLREVNREEAELSATINGIVEVSPDLFAQGVADVVRTDRLVMILVDPETHKPVALKFETPLVPPQTIRIGQRDAQNGQKLSGSYLLIGITDKDGEIFHVTPGEVYGRSKEPVPLGTEQFHLLLDQPFRGSLFNEPGQAMAGAPGGAGPAPMRGGGGPMAGGGAGPMAGGGAGPMMGGGGDADPKFSISGTITVSKALAGTVEPSDRLIILLRDPAQMPPLAFKIIPHTLLPQHFTITLPERAREKVLPGYVLTVLTDKDNNPFGAAPGEVVGRSPKPVPLGTTDLKFELNAPYTR